MREGIARPAVDPPPSNTYRESWSYARIIVAQSTCSACICMCTVFFLLLCVAQFVLIACPLSVLSFKICSAVLSPMSAVAKVKMNVRTEVDLSLPQVTC